MKITDFTCNSPTLLQERSGTVICPQPQILRRAWAGEGSLGNTRPYLNHKWKTEVARCGGTHLPSQFPGGPRQERLWTWGQLGNLTGHCLKQNKTNKMIGLDEAEWQSTCLCLRPWIWKKKKTHKTHEFVSTRLIRRRTKISVDK